MFAGSCRGSSQFDAQGQEVIRVRRAVCPGLRQVLIGRDEAKNPAGEPRAARPEASTTPPVYLKEKALRKQSVWSLLKTRSSALPQASKKAGTGTEETPQNADGQHSAGSKDSGGRT